MTNLHLDIFALIYVMTKHTIRSLQVVNVRWFNATAWYGIALARILREAGHDSLVVGLAGTESFAKASEAGLNPVALPLNTNNPLQMPLLFSAMRKLVHDFKPHVVNCHRGEAYPLWALLRASEGFALVRTRGDQRLPKANIANKCLHRYAADAVITTNSVMTRHMRSMMGVPENRLHTILGGVNPSLFYPDMLGRQRVRAEFGWNDSHTVLGLLGRFDTVKAQKETIETIARLRASGMESLRLMLAGFSTSTTQAEVESWITQAGLSDVVTITGKRSDVRACITAMDIGIVPSLWSETIARAALEIMACGVPLVSSTVGVMPDLLPAEAMFAPGDIGAMAETIQRTVVDTSWRYALRQHCEKRIHSLRDEDFYLSTIAAYRDALRQRGTCVC